MFVNGLQEDTMDEEYSSKDEHGDDGSNGLGSGDAFDVLYDVRGGIKARLGALHVGQVGLRFAMRREDHQPRKQGACTECRKDDAFSNRIVVREAREDGADEEERGKRDESGDEALRPHDPASAVLHHLLLPA